MTMQPTITCAPLFEPRKDIVAAGETAVGVQLNFELLEEPQAAEDPEAEFREFLGALPGLTFALYTHDANNLVLDAAASLIAIDEKKPVSKADPIIEWLKSWKLEGVALWHATRSEEELHDPAKVSAGQRLAGAQGWVAPLPQQAGLTRLLALSGGQDQAGCRYIVPYREGEKHANSIEIVDREYDGAADPDRCERVEIKHPYGWGRIVAAPFLGANADGTLQIDATGFLRANSTPNEDANVVALMRRMRERTGSLFWAAPHLASYEFPPASDGPDYGHRLVWRAAATLCAVFDPLFLALSMASGQRREGPFVGEAAIAIVDVDGALFEKIGEFVEEVSTWVKNTALVSATPDGLKPFVEIAAALLENPALVSARLSSPPKDGGKLDSQLIDSEPALLPLLLAVPGSGWEWGENIDFAALEERLSAELGALVGQLGSEGGIEATALAFFRHAKYGRQFIDKLFPPVPVASGSPDAERREREAQAKAVSKVETVLARFARRLGDNYDGLAAARIAVGSLFAERVPQFSDNAGGTKLPADFAALQTLVEQSNWFARRCRAVADPHPFADLTDYLAQPGGLVLSAKDRDNFVGELTRTFAEAADDLVAGLGSSARRFQPDSEPPPLPVRLTIDSDARDGDIFDQCYDGVGVLLQRGDEPWAHANLALLTERVADGQVISDPTILPLLPTEMDGTRVLVLEYNGRTFAANDAPNPSNPDENSEEQPFDPYHSHRALPDPATAGHMKLPALAYGTRYRTAAFAVSRSGVLPEAVVQGGKLHVPAIIPKPPGPDYVAVHDYSRTTAIGDIGFDRNPDDRAFAAPVQKISLLSADYPRTGMTCAKGATRHFDLWRGSDGSGLIPFPEADNQSIELNLHDVLLTGAAPIRVSIHGDPADAGATGGIELSAAEFGGDVKLSITRKNSQIELSVAGKAAMLDDCASGWVRLAFVEPVASASVRLADPAGAIGGAIAGAAGASAATLVLRPRGTTVWTADFASEATAKVRFPAMTLADIDRWLENKDLRIEAAAGYAMIDKFRVDLISVGLDLDLAEKVEKLLGALPDLAVSGLLAELVVLDALGEVVPMPALEPKKILIRKLGNYLVDHYEPGKLPAFLEKLAENHCATVEVEAGPVEAGPSASLIWAEDVLRVIVPAGHTARLSFRRLVPETYFNVYGNAPPVLAAGLRQGAIGRFGNDLVFDGPSLTIEVMDEVAPSPPFLEALAGAALSVVAAGAARSYQLQFDPQQLTELHRHEWRALGSAEVGEQRWRFLGRPIHNWFNPKDKALRHPRKVGDPAAVFWLRDDAAIADFEQEAFDAKATPIAGAAQLRPLGEVSQLSRVQWDEPSATMFRHQVSVLGRYAGAMTNLRPKVVIGKHEAPEAKIEWLRVAVLAQRSRIELTPPQLRALLPLNRAPGSGVTPPLLAMLAERPFAHGGLADRIASGVVTGLGYELLKLPATLAIKDARQEFGPDPQLSYYPLKESHSLAMTFAGDGPVGLTFDSPNAPAPTYANSAWVLTPEALLAGQSDADWQEHFVAVSMRRYLDPNWLADPELADAGPYTTECDFGETRWFELDRPNTLSCGIDLLKIERVGNSWAVKMQAQALLPEATNPDWLSIASINAPGIARLALLHQRLEAGRAALSVFALEEQGTDATRALPRLVAGCEWRCDPAADLKLVFGIAPVEAHLTSASPPAAMEWARTGRNAEKLQVRADSPGQRWPVKTLDMAGLSLEEADTDHVTFHAGDKSRVWPCPSLTDAVNPLYVHRVLALLQTDRTAGSQSVETFGQECHLVFGHRARFPGGGEGRVARLLELELPARPFGAGAHAEFGSAVFYPEEIGESTASASLLMVRPLDRPQGQSVALTAEFGIKKFRIVLPRPTTERSRAVLILLTAQAESCAAWMMDGEGNKIDLATVTLPDGVSNDVTLTAECTEEWWADVSMLTLKKLPDTPQAVPLDFAWLFGTDTPKLETSLLHDKLREMVSAQARIISVSPPLSWAG